MDRDVEAFQIARANLRNKCQTTSEHPTLVTAGQLYGAGKTQMGMHAVACVRASQEEENGIWSRLVSDGKNQAAVEDYANAVTVLVDLSIHSPDELSNFSIYLGFALYQSIRTGEESNKLLKWPYIAPYDFKHGVNSVYQLFIEETKHSIFIHWDEVGL